MSKNYLLPVIILFFFSSCAITRTETAKTLDIYGSVMHKPVIADLNVQENKVTGTAIFEAGSSLESAKNAAVADALKKANADVMIEPKFETETARGRTTVKVTGWAGTYKNFRTITKEDLPLLENGTSHKAKVYESVAQEKNKSGLGIIWALLGIGAAAAVGVLAGGL
jgi:hypothetical protein